MESVSEMDCSCHGGACNVHTAEICVPDRLCADGIHGADTEKGQLCDGVPDLFLAGGRRYRRIPA